MSNIPILTNNWVYFVVSGFEIERSIAIDRSRERERERERERDRDRDRERVVAKKEAIEPKVHIGQIEIITCNSAHLLYELNCPTDCVRYSFVLNHTSSVVCISHIDPL